MAENGLAQRAAAGNPTPRNVSPSKRSQTLDWPLLSFLADGLATNSAVELPDFPFSFLCVFLLAQFDGIAKFPCEFVRHLRRGLVTPTNNCCKSLGGLRSYYNRGPVPPRPSSTNCSEAAMQSLARSAKHLSLLMRTLPQRAHLAPAVGSIRWKTVKITFIEESVDNEVEVEATVGKSVLEAAIEHNVDIEGACGGEMACSTCHVVLSQELYNRLPVKKEEESDMLDLALGLTSTSRLCCQIKVTEDLEGAVFKIPKETNSVFK